MLGFCCCCLDFVGGFFAVLDFFFRLVFSTCILDKLVIFSLKKRSSTTARLPTSLFLCLLSPFIPSVFTSPRFWCLCYLGFLPNILTGSYKKKKGNLWNAERKSFRLQTDNSYTLYPALYFSLCWTEQPSKTWLSVLLFYYFPSVIFFLNIAFFLWRKRKKKGGVGSREKPNSMTPGTGSGFWGYPCLFPYLALG